MATPLSLAVNYPSVTWVYRVTSRVAGSLGRMTAPLPLPTTGQIR